MNADEYIKDRLEDQISWYDNKSQSAQKWYKRLRLVEFFCAALIPFLAGMIANDTEDLKIAIGGLGVIIAIITAAQGLYQWNEDWIQYRTTCESLKKEKFLFLTNSEPYDSEDQDNLNLLVQRVETLVSKENTNWAQYMMNPPESEKPKRNP
ncbi:DUF4231 domain-containing protein [Oceanobacter kriegii]|uniref:DUF4231 domain-containing protein n=1 Tax=Oceanobacter kriegii TaxID=64972 RepID=UPI000688555B|nr:DUF4231 domain-containing protein [Oceanobacter kriegii]